jgi:beta-lysine 5,6-aminomutase beta subunit
VPDGSIVRPYGDTTGDGMVQTSFTLPVPMGPKAEGAALQLATKMGLEPAMVVHSHAIDSGYTFFVVYGSVRHLVDLDEVHVEERAYPLLSSSEVNSAIKGRLHRELVVLGACIGTDAHTVGIDAILNVKGFAGEKGLEYYREMAVTNLGAQVTVPELVSRARADRADAVLVSQVVTQKDAHLRNTRELAAAFREAMGEDRPLLVVGGPRFDPAMTAELGVDKVFGRGTTPGEVASYLVHALVTPCPPPPPRDGARMTSPDPRLGLTVTHRRYVPYAHAHYGGSLVDGAYTLGLFGDVATELAIRMDGDEGLLAGYSEVRFLGPVRAGDVLEATAEVVRIGRRSRELRCTARVVARAEPERGPSAARVLEPPMTVVEATAALVVPATE